MSTIILRVLRPFPIWNFAVTAEQDIEIEEWIGKKLIACGVGVESSIYKARLEERKRKKAEAKQFAEAGMPENDQPKKPNRKRKE